MFYFTLGVIVGFAWGYRGVNEGSRNVLFLLHLLFVDQHLAVFAVEGKT